MSTLWGSNFAAIFSKKKTLIMYGDWGSMIYVYFVSRESKKNGKRKFKIRVDLPPLVKKDLNQQQSKSKRIDRKSTKSIDTSSSSP